VKCSNILCGCNKLTLSRNVSERPFPCKFYKFSTIFYWIWFHLMLFDFAAISRSTRSLHVITRTSYRCNMTAVQITTTWDDAATSHQQVSVLTVSFSFFLLLKLLFLTTASFIDSPLSLSVTLSHSFTPGLKPSFSTNPSLCNPSFSLGLTPRTVTGTSEHIRFKKKFFPSFYFFGFMR